MDKWHRLKENPATVSCELLAIVRILLKSAVHVLAGTHCTEAKSADSESAPNVGNAAQFVQVIVDWSRSKVDGVRMPVTS